MQSSPTIKLYTFNGTPITNLRQDSYESLVVETSIGNDGFCEFSVRADNSLITPDSIKMFTRVKVFEGAKCVFFGYITENNYDLQVVKIKAVSISAILKEKIAGSFTAGATYATVIGQIITAMNALGDTGISVGTISMAGTVIKTYSNKDTVDYVLKDLLGSYQMYIDPDGLLQVAQVVGVDRSASVVFKYDIRQIENSSLVNFSVRESGQGIVTRVLAMDNASGQTLVNDATLQAKYGVIDAVKTYYSVAGVPALLVEGQRDIQDRTYTPDITLSPKVADTFNVGDTVSVIIYNKFVNINTKYQILQKTVAYMGTQKQIKVKLNDNSKDFLDYIKEQDKRITQLQNN